jgi:pyruvate kinase
MTDIIHRKRTKIVATIGPASDNETTLRAMIRAGMNVARINFSHGSHAEHARRIALIRRIAKEEQEVIAILGDLQGPKIRLGDFHTIQIVPGDRLTLTLREDFDLSQYELPLPHPEFVKDIKAGQRLLIDDGERELMVLETNGEDLLCETLLGGELKQRKGVSAPDSRLTLPAITDKDRADIRFAIEQEVDWLAMSFVRQAADLVKLREHIEELGNPEIGVIAKIEKFEALENLHEIISEADGIMVARGDLGVETPAAAVPIHQKRIIRLCNQVGKPVITATQMLNSMIESPRPTRAEASDVANAIFDGTDAVMLSAESASGHYPVESVEMMTTIAGFAEEQLRAHGREHLRHLEPSIVQRSDGNKDNITADAVSHAAIQMAEIVSAKLIACSTWTGYTVRRVARERPQQPIVCVTPNPRTYYRMALVWGVYPVLVDQYHTIDEMFRVVENALTSHELATRNNKVVIIAGVPFGAAGGTNFVKVHTVT